MPGWTPRDPESWRRARGPAPAAGRDPACVARVAELLAALRSGGPDAVLRIEAALRADPARPAEEALRTPPLRPEQVQVPTERVRLAAADAPAELVRALRTARARLRGFLAPGLPRPYTHTDEAGNRAEVAVVPLRRVGVYVPGGRAPYVSSVLMTVVAARTAGVGEVVLCTPAADAGVLAAAAIAGADQVFLLAAVPALAAMAWGLGPVPACDKVAGPGNRFVVEAKRQLFGDVGIDGLPGPSELVVLASREAPAAWVAADLLAQAEHGPDSFCLLITPDPGLAGEVGREVARQAEALPAGRRADALASLAATAGPVVVADVDAGLDLAEDLAPEHLSLQGGAAEALAPRVRRAGAVFVGRWSPVAAGDYAAGTEHVLPTARAARYASALSAADFVRRVQVFTGSAAGVSAWGPAAATLARAEGFVAHARSVDLRQRAASAPARHDVAPQIPYVPPVPAGAARLDLNENPFPWPEDLWADVLAAVRAAEPTRYPRHTERLQAALAAHMGVPADWCLPANGSDELLMGVVTAWGRRAARALFPTPTFGMYRRLASAAGLPTVAVPARQDFSLPVDDLLAEVARGGETLLFLCRPNNPTGTLWPAEQVRRLVEAEGVWTVIDEAYAEFAGEDLREWLPRYPRLCLLRTMSKAWAFAGLRVGYALAQPRALAPLRQAVQPWAISAFSCAAALAALERRPWMEASVAALVAERERLTAGLARTPGLRPYPSRGNYVLFAVDPAVCGHDAAQLYERLYAAGAVLRRWRDEPALDGCLRVSVGTPQEDDRVIALLRAAVTGAVGG